MCPRHLGGRPAPKQRQRQAQLVPQHPQRQLRSRLAVVGEPPQRGQDEVDFLAGNIREIPKEGTLLPDTYNFPRGTAREQAIQRMQQSHRRVLQEIWERRNTEVPVKSPDALVTLASIIEKETGRIKRRFNEIFQ